MSPQAIAILALVTLTLLVVLFRRSRKPTVMTGNGETCPSCNAPFPPEMLAKVKQLSAAQVQQTMDKFPGQKLNLKLKVKMTCPKCHRVAEIDATPVSIA